MNDQQSATTQGQRLLRVANELTPSHHLARFFLGLHVHGQ